MNVNRSGTASQSASRCLRTSGRIGTTRKVFPWNSVFGERTRNRPKPAELDAQYLSYYLSGPQMQRDINDRHQHGGTRQALTFSQISDFEFPLPSLPEQRRIAAILDQADGVRRKRQAALALTNQFLRSTFLEMFGDPVRNPKGWEVVRVSDFTNVTGGFAFKSEHFGTVGEKVIRISDIQGGDVDTSHSVCVDVARYAAPDNCRARIRTSANRPQNCSKTNDCGCSVWSSREWVESKRMKAVTRSLGEHLPADGSTPRFVTHSVRWNRTGQSRTTISRFAFAMRESQKYGSGPLPHD